MSTTYKVEIEFATKGDLGGKVGEMGGKFNDANAAALKLGETIGGFGSKLMAPIDAVVAKVASLGVGLIKLGVAGAAGAAVYGVSVLNNELEKTQISMAAIFNANGASGDIFGGMDLAASQMAKMRQDAAALPGEFQDLANIMKGISVPGMHAGLSPDALRQMSSKLMAAGSVAGLPMDMVAREAAQLMEGRAGAHNVLGMRLAGLSGEKAEAFNKMAAPERVKMLTAELNKFAPAIELYKNSFDGISSTLLDNAKQFLGAATGPLFEKVKETMGDANKWFDANKDKIMSFAKTVGARLGEAFDWAKAKIEEWWPAISTFANNLYEKLAGIWEKLGPSMSGFGESIKEFLKSPDAIDKIIRALELYIAAKAIGGAAGASWNLASGIMGMSGPLAGVMNAGGAAGGAAGAAGAGGMFAGASTGVAGIGLTGGAAVAATAGAAAAALAGVGLAAWQAAELYNDIEKTHSDNTKARVEGGLRLIESMQRMDYGNEQYTYILDKLREAGDMAAVSTLQFAAAAKDAANDLKDRRAAFADQEATAFGTYKSVWHAPQSDGSIEKALKAKHPGGAGTNIQKVEIVVTSNQDPSRIARRVVGEIENLKRNPRISPDVPNWGGALPVAG